MVSMGYIANFIVYTLAMVGVIVFALFVFKNVTSASSGKASKNLKVIDSMSLGQRKMLYIVSAGKEKFLIAGDVDKTSLISKLELDEEDTCTIKRESLNDTEINAKQTFQDTMRNVSKKTYFDRSFLSSRHNNQHLKDKNSINSSVMRNLVERIK